MKKHIKIATTGLILFSVILFAGCFNPIFYEIRKDVRPETATVSGNIPNITRYTDSSTEYLFLAADGGLRYKRADNNTHGNWDYYPTPFNLISYNYAISGFPGQQLISVYADANYLYLLSAEYSTTGSEGITKPSAIHIWAKENAVSNKGSNGWTDITENATNSTFFPIVKILSTGYYESRFNLFQTNAPQAGHRAVYLCSVNTDNNNCTYYKLNGTTGLQSITPETITTVDDATFSSTTRIYSAAYFGGVHFFTSKVATTNETLTTDANHIYYANGNILRYSSDGTNYSDAVNAGDTISSLATCSDAILIGRGATNGESSHAGITKTSLTNGVPGNTLQSFTTNAAFQMTDIYVVLSLMNSDPRNSELQSNLYASITFYGSNGVYNKIGLWSYYPWRGNWNRE